MPRVRVPPDAVQGETVAVTDPRALHHLRDVLRVKVGDRLECFDGHGRSYAGPIARCTSRGLVVEITERLEGIPRLLKVTLVQALIKPERFEWALEKATELGVARIIPVETARTTARISGREGRRARWQRIIESAAAQCGRATVPRLEPPEPFGRALKMLDSQPTLLPTLAEDGSPLAEQLGRLRDATQIALLIGPEGDFSPEEVTMAAQHGALPVRLSRSVLRSETAAIAVLAILQHSFASW